MFIITVIVAISGFIFAEEFACWFLPELKTSLR